MSDENRPRSNGSETRDRCRLIRTLGLSYARRSFPPIDLLARSSPDLGAGEHLRHASKGEPAGGGRAKMRRSVLAFPYSLRSSFVCPFSRSPPSCSLVVVCGISYRLARRLVLPSRSIVSFPVCLFLFPPQGVSLVVSSSLLVIASYRLAFLLTPFVFARPFVRSSFPHSLRSSVRLRLVPVRLRLRPRSSSSLS